MASPTLGACDPAVLAARITRWEAGAGHRFASVELTYARYVRYAGDVSCTIHALSQPQLVDGSGSVLIDGGPPAPSAALTIAPGGILKTAVQVANYCGPTPVPPVTVAFIFPSGLGRIVAAPTSPTDTTGVPPCLGEPGSAGEIEMQPWAP